MKRRLPTASGTTTPTLADVSADAAQLEAEHREINTASRPSAHASTSASEKKRPGSHLQIHPLQEDPVLQTLTPRSFAKSVAELDALRSRVQELEQKLLQHDVEMLPPASTPSKSKLPPLAHQDLGEVISLPPAVLHSSSPVLDPIAVAPDPHHRKPVAPPLVLLPTSPSKKLLVPVLEPLRLNDDSEVTLAVDHADHTSTSPPSPASSVMSTSSPHREQAKMTLGLDGDSSFSISQRQRLYQILKRISGLVPIEEDDLILLKKLVDAEIGDVISFLLGIESTVDTVFLEETIAKFLETGSPAKQKQLHQQFRLELPRHYPVWSIQYPLQKIARNLEQLRAMKSSVSGSPSKDHKLDVIVLVASGAYNPIHMLHLRAFYVARQYVESNYKFPVVGAFISPSHDTFVRVKNRRNPHEMITKRHRLSLIEAAVASSSWIEVDKWEITRRRVLDYLSTLTHVREMCETHFRDFKFHLVYVCGCNTVVKLSHSALRDEGFGCITVCRPTQTQMVMKHLGKTLAKSTTIVEDTGVLPVELERATSFRVRQTMAAMATNPQTHDKQVASLEMMIGKPALQYMMKNAIPLKVAGKEAWHDEDKAWRDADLTYVEYIEG